LRKGLTVGAVFVSVVLAGCSGGGATTEPPSSAPAESPAPPSSSRTAPAKSLQVADKCSVLTAEQQQSLGISSAPQPDETDGMQGCLYVAGEAGTETGWNAFVYVTTKQTMQQFAEVRPGAQPTTVAGYPAVNTVVNNRNCTVAVDVSDQGSVIVNGLSRDPAVNGCDVLKRVAEVVVPNLPNA
jgi:hypothetical protein